MTENNAESPSARAFALLRERVADDGGLDDRVKGALLADLAAARPAALERLRATITAWAADDEADEPDSA